MNVGNGLSSSGFFFSAAGQIVRNMKEKADNRSSSLHIIGSASVRLAL